jgi:peptidoglycan/LPS O-acetylase OafA/YrhL
VQNSNSGSNPDVGSNSDDLVRAHHEQALARGEKRVLFRTVEGRLHSYAEDELGVATAGSQPQVRSAAGFLVLAVVFAAFAVFSVLLAAGPTSRGQDPMWGALFLTVLGVAGVLYIIRMAKEASRAKRLRAERGIPEPTARQLDW